MRILGVDPGLKATGYGLIEIRSSQRFQAHLLEAGTIEPKTRDVLDNKLQKIYTSLCEIVLQYTPDVMVLEKLYSHYRHPTTACLLGHVRGVIILVSAHSQLKVVEHSVKRIRKSLSGNGNSSKQQIREVVMHILKIKSDNLTLDASDALALALGYARMHDVLN